MKEKSGYKKTKNAVRIVTFLVLLSALTIWTTRLLESKASYTRFGGFYEEDVGYDVLFFGSSRMYADVFPMEMWRDYGITSFNMGASSGTLPVSYYLMLSAFERTTPKLAVIDCGNLAITTKRMATPLEYIHSAFDRVPLGPGKVEAILDLMEDEDRKWEFLWDLIVYHERWDELTENDFDPPVSIEKGGVISPLFTAPATFAQLDESIMTIGDTPGVQYLRMMIEECRSRGIEVLLTYLPIPAGSTNQMESRLSATIAEEYGVDYINFLKLDVVDYQTDCRDPAAHLNASGGEKVSAYLGKYIQDRYGIPDQRDNPDYTDWADDYAAFTAYKAQLLSQQTDLSNYMLMLYDKHLSFCLYMEGDKVWSENRALRGMLENAGVKDPPRQGETPTVAVMDNNDTGGGISYLKAGESLVTSFGTVSFKTTSRGHAIYIDGREAVSIENELKAGAVVIDNDTGAVATTSRFTIRDMSVTRAA